MYHNDEHTLSFADERWRTGDSMLPFEWIFDPSQFRKDFGNGEERLRYGAYEQLEALPGFNATRSGGAGRAQRAGLTMAFMSYLFYFSAYIRDKSGRLQHCLNSWQDGAVRRGFIDKSKIVTPRRLAATPA